MPKRIKTQSRGRDLPSKDGQKWLNRKGFLLSIVTCLVVLSVIGTLLVNKTTIAQKFSADEYFTEAMQSDENDQDGDALRDEDEVELGTDPQKRDTDGDGLSDGEEVNVYKTDPLKTDTDNDKYIDSVEVYSGHDPNKAPEDISSELSSKDRNDRYADAGLGTIDSLLNDDPELRNVDLEEMGVAGLDELSSLFGGGNASNDIIVVDSDIAVRDVPEDQAKPEIDAYVQELTNALLETFEGDTESIYNTFKDFRVGMGGQFYLLDDPAQHLAAFTDKVFEIEVPSPAAGLHKDFLESLMLTESLVRGLSMAEDSTTDPMILMARMNQVEQAGAKTEQELDRLSSLYELGLSSDIFSSVTSE